MGKEYYETINTSTEFQDIEDASEFYQAIDRRNLTKELSPERPYVYWTMEVYDKSNGLKGAGGLGVLAADTRRVAEQLEMPFVVVTPFYRTELRQEVRHLRQTEVQVSVSPDEYGYYYLDDVTVSAAGEPAARLSIFVKELGSTKFVTISEPNFGELYAGPGSGDHRLYQEVALGFGGYRALRKVGAKPAIIQLNETATIFAAIARLDELCRNGMNLYEAIVYVRKHTLYTNHTLVQAAEGEFQYAQFEKYVYPNIKSKALKHWIDEQFSNGRIKLSTLAIELAEAKNGVSRLHARVANYRDGSGERVKFHAVTNGIDMKTWVLPEIMAFYLERGIIDKFGLVSSDYEEKILSLKAEELRELRKIGRKKMNDLLADRKNQYGNNISLPDDALIFDFKRRFVDYKRPEMPFTNLEALKSILKTYNAHYILAGRVNVGDDRMYDKLQKVLAQINSDEFLRERVHYIQDYDETVGLALSVGADAAVNIPVVGLEACGTSWEKDIANMKLLLSTADGGVADVLPLPCLEVVGRTFEEEVSSLYEQMRRAGDILHDDRQFEEMVRHQLIAYLPVISGARMIKDYLKFLFK